jgi:membrane protease YdiL (CAAX protease family)
MNPAAEPDAGALPPPPPSEPFWKYTDLMLFIGLAIASLALASGLAAILVYGLGVSRDNRLFVAVPAQFLAWGLLFVSLAAALRARYGRPFWASLGWKPGTISPGAAAIAGVGLAFAIAVLSLALRTPDIDSPMKEYLSHGPYVVLLGVFGTTAGPLCEELAFRGFMQPLFVRSLGRVVGVLLAALPFGLLHLQQYGWSWRHGLLITLAGAGFGWMRLAAGSTRAAAFMHMAYNGTFFVALLAQRKALPLPW